MICESCTAGRNCKHKNNIKYESMRIIKRLVKVGVIDEKISGDLIDKIAGTILEHCIRHDLEDHIGMHIKAREHG